MVKIGIVGFGRMGQRRAEDIEKHLDNAKVLAVSDPHISENARRWAAEHSISVHFDYQDMVVSEKIDAVLICTATDLHCPVALQAFDAGKHVFVEKPIACTLEDAKTVCSAAKQAGRKLQVGFNRRFDHNYKALRTMVEDGTVGDVHLLRIAARDIAIPPYDYVAHSGGMFMDFQIHDFDMVRFLTGCDVTEVFAWGDAVVDPKLREYGDIDTGTVTLRLSNGGYAVIDASRYSAARAIDRRAEISGRNGQAYIENDRASNAVVSSVSGTLAERPLSNFNIRFAQSYVEEISAFINAIEQDTPTPVNEIDGLKAIQIAYAANKSMAEHRPVRIDEIS